jgi:hypothetical protein
MLLHPKILISAKLICDSDNGVDHFLIFWWYVKKRKKLKNANTTYFSDILLLH